MNGVSCGQVRVTNDDFSSLSHGLHGYGQHLVDHLERDIETGLDCIAPVDCHVSMEDLLEGLCVGNEPPFLCDGAFEQAPCIHLMGMLSSNEIHRHV